MKARRRIPAIERFLSKVDFDGPIAANEPALGQCWDWVGNFGSGPYGLFWDDRMMNAHKWAYESWVGLVPEGLELDHFACDRKSCVNPDHLRPVAHAENMARAASPSTTNRLKTHCHLGHAFDSVNTYIVPSTGDRQCRTCKREALRRSRAKVAATL